jgi:hypothetical protein
MAALFAEFGRVFFWVFGLMVFAASGRIYYEKKHHESWKRHLPGIIEIAGTITVIWTLILWATPAFTWFQNWHETKTVSHEKPATVVDRHVQVVRPRHVARRRAKLEIQSKANNLAITTLLPICDEFIRTAISSGQAPYPSEDNVPEGTLVERAGGVGDLPNSTGAFTCKLFFVGGNPATYVLHVQDNCTGRPSSSCMVLQSVSREPN